MNTIPEEDYFWGPVTATIDWCEENYAVSPYVAEFINTTTNLSFGLLSLFGIYNTIRYGSQKSFIVAHLGILLVGFGSWWFHMTLQYEMQLLDELPMIYVGCIMVYFSIEVYSQSRFGSPLILFLLGYSAFVTYSYLIINDPVFHQVAYAILVITIVFRSVYLVKHLPPQTTNERPHLVRLLRLAAAGFILSFAVWNVDNQFCSYFRHARTLVPYAIGALTQLHGWWHIGTSLGVFYFTVFLEWMQLILDEKNTQQYELVWVGGIICYLRPLDKSHKA